MYTHRAHTGTHRHTQGTHRAHTGYMHTSHTDTHRPKQAHPGYMHTAIYVFTSLTVSYFHGLSHPHRQTLTQAHRHT